MKRNAWIISIILLVVGIVGRIYANAYSYVDEAGMLHDSIWYPISGLLILISVVALVILGLIYVVGYFRNRPN